MVKYVNYNMHLHGLYESRKLIFCYMLWSCDGNYMYVITQQGRVCLIYMHDAQEHVAPKVSAYISGKSQPAVLKLYVPILF